MGYLITGSKGFIGRNLTSYLDMRGISYGKVEKSTIHYDTLIHLSAETNVRESIKNPYASFKKNTIQTYDLLDISRQEKTKKFVFASSMGVTDPCSPYLASKASGEAYCTAFRKSYNLNTHIARFSNVYGPRSEFKDSIVAKFIKSCINKEPFQIYGNGNQTRDFIYVEDIVKSLLKTIGPKSNICSGITTTINEVITKLIHLAIELLDYTPHITHIKEQSGEINNVRKTPGLNNPTNLDIGLRNTFKWFLRHQ